jgi:hypothetical protein
MHNVKVSKNAKIKYGGCVKVLFWRFVNIVTHGNHHMWKAKQMRSSHANQILTLGWEAINVVNMFLNVGYQLINEGS